MVSQNQQVIVNSPLDMHLHFREGTPDRYSVFGGIIYSTPSDQYTKMTW